jgi:hypothetical protein
MKNYFVWIVLFFLTAINAQKSKELLFQLVTNKNIPEIKKIDYLCELSLMLTKKDSLQAYEYAKEALKISIDMDSKIKQVIALENLSKLAALYSDIPNQIKFTDQCFELAKVINTPEAMAYANYAMAQEYDAITDKEKYISYMLKALSYFEKTKTRYDKLVNGYENLGAHFGDTGNDEVCEKYVKKALDLGLESKNPINRANGLTSWALFLVN